MRLLLVACLAFVVTGCPKDDPAPGADASTPKVDGGEECPVARKCPNTCCPVGQECVADTCQAVACAATETECGNDCCTSTESCVNDVCVPKGNCTPACSPTSTTPVCEGTVCKCNSTSCGTSASCVNGACVANTCTPACSGTTPVCEGTVCKCDSTSCGNTATCTNGVCVPVSSCTGTQTECGTDCCENTTEFCQLGTCVTKTACTGTQTSCGADCCDSPDTCVDDVCVGSNPGTCTVASTYGSVIASGRAEIGVGQSGDAYAYMSGPLPASDGTADEIQIELLEGYGVFTNGLVTGTFPLTGDELNYATCGACVTLHGDVDPTTGVTAYYMITGGTLNVTSVSGSLVATLTGATFEEVEIDSQTYESTPVPNGCTSAVQQALFHGTTPVECDPLAPTACTAGQGCFYDGSGLTCSDVGTAAPGDACSETVQCVAGAQCLQDGLCHSWCDTSAANTCTGGEVCTPAASSGTLGICDACPEEQVCGSACCGADQICTDGVCGDPVTCNPLDPQACPNGQNCYFSADTELYACGPVGQGEIQAECATGADCVAGTDCIAVSQTASMCLAFCDPAVASTCNGQCFDWEDGTGSCIPADECDLLAQDCPTATDACYPGTINMTCEPEGQKAVGQTCAAQTECVGGAICVSTTCTKLCATAGGDPACAALDSCEPVESGSELGLCKPCPAAQVCGNVCCSSTQMCDASTACVAIPPPANDVCGADGANAIALTLDAAATAGNTVAAANDYGAALSAACDASGPAAAPGPDAVFVYTPAADGDFIVVVEPQFDAVLWYTTGSCGVDGDCLKASDTNSTETIRVNGAVAGTKYFFYVDGYEAEEKGAVTILVKSPPVAPANDKCGVDGANATALTLGTPVTGDTTAAADDYHYPISAACDPSTYGDLTGNDAVFKYTPAAAGNFTVTVTPAATFDAAVWYTTGTCGDPMACVVGVDVGMSGGAETLTIAGAAGTTYFIVVDGWKATALGEFTITVQ
ncbi:MAG: hypothetical protein HY901_24575 [Deltaproteobacteria bacterium]|nr:hypothetical protein [Deltaproteobacteria bacterium]